MPPVTLHIYDLSGGLARQFSPAILGKQIDAIYHTGVSVFGREYYFGGGICVDPPCMTPYGTPLQRQLMGTTDKTEVDFVAFLTSISHRFQVATYHLLENNCNNFSDACVHFLLGAHIPQHILDLPAEAMNSPLGPMIRPMIDQMQASITQQSAGHQLQIASSPSPLPSASAHPSSSTTPALRTLQQTTPNYWESPETLSSPPSNRPKILRKLCELNNLPLQSPEPTIDKLISISLSNARASVFPALDLLRIHAINSASVDSITPSLSQLLPHFTPSHTPESVPSPALLMSLRLLANLCIHPSSATFLCSDTLQAHVTDLICDAWQAVNANVCKTASVLMFNYCGAPLRFDARKLSEDNSVRLLYSAVTRLQTDDVSLQEALWLCKSLFIMSHLYSDTADLIKTFELDLAAVQRRAGLKENADLKQVITHLTTLLTSSAS